MVYRSGAKFRGEWGCDMIGDPFLNYFALGLLIFVVVVIFYGIIAIHDIPAKIAEKRHHPHADAIHAAGWVSLFTLQCSVAISLDLGDGLPPRTRLGRYGDRFAAHQPERHSNCQRKRIR